VVGLGEAAMKDPLIVEVVVPEEEDKLRRAQPNVQMTQSMLDPKSLNPSISQSLNLSVP
jgi:hypothetical protein